MTLASKVYFIQQRTLCTNGELGTLFPAGNPLPSKERFTPTGIKEHFPQQEHFAQQGMLYSAGNKEQLTPQSTL
jgi:hypothetical protein